ncbi:MAG: YeeE/YedE family protein [Kangiellaceae bacterium]|nr:YeeE/YedE family protein [Kangiellaceae bacterium]
MTEFSPLSGLLGGAIIGFSAAILMLFRGRTAGISGIVNGLMSKNTSDISWRALFIIGLILGPLVATLIDFELPSRIDLSWQSVTIGGLLVGFGTNLGNGCTSGHGICGIGRFSSRSILATIIFMLVAVITVYFCQHLLGDIL